jgi:hypothetical protein
VILAAAVHDHLLHSFAIALVSVAAEGHADSAVVLNKHTWKATAREPDGSSSFNPTCKLIRCPL